MGKRGQNEGSVYKRKDGRWAGSITLGYRNGKRVRRHFYGATQKEVNNKLIKAKRDVQQGLPLPAERLTVGQFLKDWLEQHVRMSVRPKTQLSYEQIVRIHLLPELGGVHLSKLSPQIVQQLLDQKLKEGLSARTVQYIRAVLRHALSLAERWGLVARNAAKLVDGPRVGRSDVKPFSPDEVGSILRNVSGERLCVLYLLTLALGLRQGEALGLRWKEDVDLDAKRLRVNVALQWVKGEAHLVEPKTARSRRVIDLPDYVVTELRKHRARQAQERLLAGSQWHDSGLVFTTSSGKPLDGCNVTRDFQRFLKRIGVPPRRFHDLRHTTATLLLTEGQHPVIVSELLGHEEVRTTLDIYSHVLPGHKRAVADRMEALLTDLQTKKPA